MLDKLDQENRPLLKTLARKRRRTFWILSIKTLINHIWRPIFWCCLFAGLWMLDVQSFFGQIISIILSLSFVIGLIYLIKKDLRSFSLPKGRKLDHALEKNSNLPRGQINLIEDTLVNPKKKETRELWNTAQRNALNSFTLLKAPKLNLSLARQDPGALRFIAILVLISGFMVSGHDWKNKIISGLIPITPNYVLAQGKVTNLWIEPPAYTQRPKVHVIGTSAQDTLEIAEGSTIKIRLHSIMGKSFPPYFQGKEMTYLDEGLYGAETEITEGTDLSVTQFYIPRARWAYTFIKDTPPQIFSDLPNTDKNSDETSQNQDNSEQAKIPEEQNQYEIIERGQIKFPLKVLDDYGVKDLRMTMEIDPMIQDKPLGETASETRLIMSQPNTEFKIAPIYNMTWHTWAGLPVTFTFEAIDHKGQTAKLEPITLTLPEREFEHPMAKSLITMRKKLAWEYDSPFDEIAFNLETLLRAPDYFQNNPTIYLAIKSAAARLRYNDDARPSDRIKAVKEVIGLLWTTAITIEDGNLELAMRELRDAQEALENAMRDPNVTQDEIDALMNELREKMENYFTEMARDLQKRMQNGEKFPEFSNEDFGQMITPDTLGQMMAEIEQALRDGDEEKAQELMSKLQRMMEMMDPSSNAQMPPDMQMMKEGINELQELIERQEQLLEQTEKQAMDQFRQERKKERTAKPKELKDLNEMLKNFGFDTVPPTPGTSKQTEDNKEPNQQDKTERSQKPSEKSADEKSADKKNTDEEKNNKSTAANKAEQEALRYILGQLMLDAAEKLDEVPESLGNAEQEMRGSSEKLGENNPTGSIPYQEQAIEYLKEGQEQLAQQFRNRMQQMIGIGFSGQQRYDPLGRPLGDDQNDGRNHGSRVEVPDEAQKKRVDEILRELRERSGDRSRSDDELDYYRRLLRQF